MGDWPDSRLPAERSAEGRLPFPALTLGVALGIVLLVRLTWRLIRRETLPPIDSGLLHVVARVTHGGLYVLLILTVGPGIATEWTRGDSIFNLFSIQATER